MRIERWLSELILTGVLFLAGVGNALELPRLFGVITRWCWELFNCGFLGFTALAVRLRLLFIDNGRRLISLDNKPRPERAGSNLFDSSLFVRLIFDWIRNELLGEASRLEIAIFLSVESRGVASSDFSFSLLFRARYELFPMVFSLSNNFFVGWTGASWTWASALSIGRCKVGQEATKFLLNYQEQPF